MKSVKARVVIGSVAMAMIVLASVPAVSAQETSIKIAVVDLQRVVGLSAQGKALQDKLEKFRTTVQTEGEAKAASAREIRQRITDGVNSLSEEKLAELQKEYEDVTIDIRRFQDDKQRQGEKLQAEGLREIEKLLEPVFKEIKDANGYDLILNNTPGVVVMANEKVDITQRVVERLNATLSPGE